jgi:predicted lipid-binding transport protein (Tim44 family)
MDKQHEASIPSIKYFGTTWYERGWPYWRRRFWLAALGLLVATVITGAASIVFFGLFELVASLSGRLIAAGVAAVPAIWSCYSTYLKLRRSPEDRAAHRPMSFAPQSPERVRAGSAKGMATGAFASGGSGLAGTLIAVGSLFVVGQGLGYFAITLGKYVNEEEWQLARKYGLER